MSFKNPHLLVRLPESVLKVEGLITTFIWMVQLELILSSATVVVAIYSLVAGIFGMNIPYTWNTEHAYVFKWVHNRHFSGSSVQEE